MDKLAKMFANASPEDLELWATKPRREFLNKHREVTQWLGRHGYYWDGLQSQRNIFIRDLLMEPYRSVSKRYKRKRRTASSVEEWRAIIQEVYDKQDPAWSIIFKPRGHPLVDGVDYVEPNPAWLKQLAKLLSDQTPAQLSVFKATPYKLLTTFPQVKGLGPISC